MKARGNSKERTAIAMLVLATWLVTLLLLVQSKTVCVRTVRQARESALKQDLQEMQKAIDDYTLKTGSPYIRDWRQIPAMLSYGGPRTKREASRQVVEFRHKSQVQVHISCFLDS